MGRTRWNGAARLPLLSTSVTLHRIVKVLGQLCAARMIGPRIPSSAAGGCPRIDPRPRTNVFDFERGPVTPPLVGVSLSITSRQDDYVSDEIAATESNGSAGDYDLSRRFLLIMASLGLGGALAGLDGLIASVPAHAAPIWNYPFAGSRVTNSDRWGDPRPSSDHKIHMGLDYVAPPGRGVHAVAAGTVRPYFDHGGWAGNKVLIEHAGGYHSLYAHLLDGTVAVHAGQVVAAGTYLGGVGDTGLSYGDHLHLEIWTSGSRTRATSKDPAFLDNYPLADQIQPEDDMYSDADRARDQATHDRIRAIATDVSAIRDALFKTTSISADTTGGNAMPGGLLRMASINYDATFTSPNPTRPAGGTLVAAGTANQKLDQILQLLSS